MNLYKSLLIGLAIFSLTVIFNGCQENQIPIAPENQNLQSLNKWTLPAGSTLDMATLYIRLSIANDQTVNVHRITSDWDEMTVTWGNFGSSFDPSINGSFATGTTNEVWLTVDITSLVQSWLNGTNPNYGLLLDQVAMNYPRAEYYSRENFYKPYLKLDYTMGGGGSTSIELLAIADTYIYEIEPTVNHGASPVLYTGWLNANDLEKQTLIKFDLGPAGCETAYAYEEEPDGTCFMDLGFSNWGWSIKLQTEGTYTFPVYAGAGQCDPEKGTLVGSVTANYSGGTVQFTYNFLSGFSTNETHFYAGYDSVPKDKKGKSTVAPGQYTIGTGLSGPIYIIAHAVVCGDYSE